MNETKKNTTNVVKTVKISTRKSILLKFALLQFAGMLLLAVAIITVAIIFAYNKADAAASETEATTTEPQIQVVEKEVEVIKEIPVEVEVEKTVYVDRVVEVEKPIETIIEVEKPVEVIKEVIVEKEVPVVDQEAVEARAQELFEQWKAQYIADQEAAAEAEREATKSSISVYVSGHKTNGAFWINIEGYKGELLTFDMIKSVLLADARMDGYTIQGTINKDAIEYFNGEDYNSTRIVKIIQQ